MLIDTFYYVFYLKISIRHFSLSFLGPSVAYESLVCGLWLRLGALTKMHKILNLFIQIQKKNFKFFAENLIYNFKVSWLRIQNFLQSAFILASLSFLQIMSPKISEGFFEFNNSLM